MTPAATTPAATTPAGQTIAAQTLVVLEEANALFLHPGPQSFHAATQKLQVAVALLRAAGPELTSGELAAIRGKIRRCETLLRSSFGFYEGWAQTVANLSDHAPALVYSCTGSLELGRLGPGSCSFEG
jgi:hypothetical protein